MATVDTRPFIMGISSNAYYDKNAKIYMIVGLGQGEAVVKLLKPGT